MREFAFSGIIKLVYRDGRAVSVVVVSLYLGIYLFIV